jgi:4-amino-4-deoxy-L-arabinose transferase-like glycosyltransferase
MAEDHFSAPVAQAAAPFARPPATTEGKQGRFSPARLARLATGPWPLAGILVLQAGLSLRLVWSNTAYQDEALYLWAGHLEWAHWLHGAAVPDFASYFSGAPVIYPPLGALAASIGGLAAARILSLGCMLATTALLYAVTKRLFGRPAAMGGAVAFAVIGPTQFLGALATFDALAVLLLALASWLAVRSGSSGKKHGGQQHGGEACGGDGWSGDGWSGEKWLVCCAVAMALADAAKYTSLLWNPVIIALAVLGPAGPWPRSARRGIRLAGYTAALIVPPLFLAGGHSYLAGIMSTTLARPGSTVPVLRVLGASAGWIGVVAVLAIAGAIAVTRKRRGRRRTTLAWVLAAAAFLAPAGEARLHTDFSLFKHLGFGAWFACIVAGYALAALARALRARPPGYARLASGLAWFLVTVSGAALATAHFAAWPDSAQMIHGLAPVIERTGCPCLIAENDVVRYYLMEQTTQDTFTTVFVMKYRTGGRELSGIPAYRAAIGDHYFRLVEIDPAEMPAVYAPVVRALKVSQYRLVVSTPSNTPGEPIEIWVRDRAR